MFGELVTPFELSTELTNPADTYLPAEVFTPPDNVKPVPLIMGDNLGWNWYQYVDLSSPTNSIPQTAEPAPLPIVLPSADNPIVTIGELINNPPATSAPAPETAKASNNSLLIGAAVIGALYLLNI